MDVYALLISYIAALPGIKSVHEDLTEGVDLGSLPCVAVHSAGPAQRRPALQGLGVDVVSIDVHLYISRSAWMKGQAYSLAEMLRRHLSVWRRGQIRAVDVSRPDRLPDRNPNIRRLGMTVDIHVPIF